MKHTVLVGSTVMTFVCFWSILGFAVSGHSIAET
jgi:hypothetical protein